MYLLLGSTSEGLFEIDFIPAGQAGRHGDAIAVWFTKQDGSTAQLVIDGGFEDTGAALVDQVTRWHPSQTIDLAILTHPDQDHIGGMETILRRLDVRTLCLHRIGDRGGAALPAAERVANLIRVAGEEGTAVVEAFAPIHDFDGALKILSPREDWYEQLVRDQVVEARTTSARRRPSVLRRAGRRFLAALPGERRFDDDGGTNPRNNSSIVTLLEVDGVRMLFPADAGVPALERAWDELASFGASDHAPYFIQMPHHGSRKNGSSATLDRILGPVGQPQSKHAYVNVAPEAELHPSSIIHNAFIRRGYEVRETRGQQIYFHSAGLVLRPGWTPIAALPPMDEAGEV